jgi:hypothetical protein
MTNEFVAVVFEHGKPVRTEYVPTAGQAQALVEEWEAQSLQASWATRADWERLQARSPGAADKPEDESWPLRGAPDGSDPPRSYCTACGSPARSEDEYCANCGQPLAPGSSQRLASRASGVNEALSARCGRPSSAT